MKKKVWRLAVALAFMALCAAGLVYWYGFLRKEKPMERMKADVEITADSLLSVFLADEKTATERFGGKILLLKADLLTVVKEENSNVTLTLVDPMMGVTCTIDSLQSVRQKSDIAALTEGAPVTIKGRCDGMLTDVKLSKCILVK